jgi:hypothetical protein
MESLKPRAASYYYKRCIILHLILEPWFFPRELLPRKIQNFLQKKSKKNIESPDDHETKAELFFAYVRFLLVLSAWLAVLFIACDHFGILKTIGKDKEEIVGFLADWANFGICLWMVVGMALLLLILRKLDAVLLNFLNIIDCSNDAREFDRLKSEVEHARQFICINTPWARRLYRLLMLVSTGLVLWYALAMPLLGRHTAHSWALEPVKFPGVFVIAQPWAYFWVTVVFAHFIWFIFCIIYFVFWRISVYASRKRIIVPPISVDERGGLRSIGELVFMVMLLSSGGLMIVVGWHLIFQEPDANVRFVIRLYAMILIFLYVLPIWYLKTALKYSRDRHLAAWGGLFVAACSSMVGAASFQDTKQDVARADPEIVIIKTSPLQEIASIENIYTRVEKMPRSPVSMFLNIVATIYLATPFISAPLYAFNIPKRGSVLAWLAHAFGLK